MTAAAAVWNAILIKTGQVATLSFPFFIVSLIFAFILKVWKSVIRIVG